MFNIRRKEHIRDRKYNKKENYFIQAECKREH